MKHRYEWLDLWRSLAVCVMVVFHALWDVELFEGLPSGTMGTAAAEVVRYLGGGSFILISGMLVLSSERAVRRGFILFCVGIAVAVATHFVGMPVKFGILQLIGVCMMLCGALRTQLRRVSGLPLLIACLLLFAGTWALTARVRVPLRFLYPLGLRAADFYSLDYWPLLPWGFLYLSGSQLGTYLRPERAGRRRIPAALTFPGRHSLAIYLLHQPILYGIFWLLYSGKN